MSYTKNPMFALLECDRSSSLGRQGAASLSLAIGLCALLLMSVAAGAQTEAATKEAVERNGFSLPEEQRKGRD